MKLLLEAESETARPCPVDGETMKKEVAHMIVIDRCPKCQGVWLDGGELERIKGGVEAKALMAMANGFTVPFS
jgi:Zn-finger nucleic acid-binding protein